jgi:DNA modification methylase
VDPENATPEEQKDNERIGVLRAELIEYYRPMTSIPCTVLDPFGGAGTTLLVATKLKRRCVSFDIKLDYLKMAGKRTTNLQVNLL